MSAVRREFINLNVNGHHLKSVPDVNCVNGGVGGGGAQKEKRNWETIFLFSVILLQTICTVVGFIVFAYFVDQKFENERMIISSKIFFLNSEIELLKKNISMKQNRSMPRGGMMPPIHGKAEVMKVVTVETVEEWPEMENLRNEQEYDESEEEDEYDEEPQTGDNAEIRIDSNRSSAPTSPNSDISPLRDQASQNRIDLQRTQEKKQQLLANLTAKNTSRQLDLPKTQNPLVELNDNEESDEEHEELSQTADNAEINLSGNKSPIPTNLTSNESLPHDQETLNRLLLHRNLQKQQSQATNVSTRNISGQLGSSQTRTKSINLNQNEQNDETLRQPVVKTKHIPIKDSEMLQRNTNREHDSAHPKPRIARSVPEKRHVNPVQDSGQPRLNAITPTPFHLTMDSEKESNSATNNVWSWPAAHFDSHDLSSQTNQQRTNSADDCPREIQNNQKKWKHSELSGSEHFDLKNYENITVKKEGLYFVYGQIYFYKDRSIFGYLIKKENQSVLQCSIHSPTNRTSNGSGTTCFTAGLVYLKPNDVLRLELFNESGKCVRWGPGKSFIGLFKLPQGSSTFL